MNKIIRGYFEGTSNSYGELVRGSTKITLFGLILGVVFFPFALPLLLGLWVYKKLNGIVIFK